MTSPTRYRLVHESRAEYVLPLSTSVPAVAELLDAVRTALLGDGRSVTEATVHLHEGELVASFMVEPDAGPAQAAAQVVNLR